MLVLLIPADRRAIKRGVLVVKKTTNLKIMKRKSQSTPIKCHVIEGIDTSKFKEGDKLILDPDKPGAFTTFDKIIQKENMKADAVAAGFMFLGHLLLVGFSDFFPNILPYFIVLGLFALAGFFFLGRVLIYKFKN